QDMPMLAHEGKRVGVVTPGKGGLSNYRHGGRGPVVLVSRCCTPPPRCNKEPLQVRESMLEQVVISSHLCPSSGREIDHMHTCILIGKPAHQLIERLLQPHLLHYIGVVHHPYVTALERHVLPGRENRFATLR